MQTITPAWAKFQSFARERMSEEMGVELLERRVDCHPKCFDFVSGDHLVVGDAKYLSLVHGKYWPPAKAMEIAGHVLMLERTPAARRFLVFGNQRRVVTWWLEKYGLLVTAVEFYYLSEDGVLEKLDCSAYGAPTTLN